MWIQSYHEIINRFPWRADDDDADDDDDDDDAVLPAALRHVFTLPSARRPGLSCGRGSLTTPHFKKNHIIPDIRGARRDDGVVFVAPAD